jgi:hypothetical protein
MKRTATLRRALSDPNLLSRALAGDTWGVGRTLLIAAMGEQERVRFCQLTSDTGIPGPNVGSAPQLG